MDDDHTCGVVFEKREREANKEKQEQKQKKLKKKMSKDDDLGEPPYKKLLIENGKVSQPKCSCVSRIS